MVLKFRLIELNFLAICSTFMETAEVESDKMTEDSLELVRSEKGLAMELMVQLVHWVTTWNRHGQLRFKVPQPSLQVMFHILLYTEI